MIIKIYRQQLAEFRRYSAIIEEFEALIDFSDKGRFYVYQLRSLEKLDLAELIMSRLEALSLGS